MKLNNNNNCKLTEMFKLQNQLQEKLGTWKKIESEQDKQLFINQTILAMQEEVVEIMRETSYKNPKYVKFGWKQGQYGDPEKLKEEIVDLWHFVMNMAMIAGMDAQEFYEIYCKKNNVNHKRQKDNY